MHSRSIHLNTLHTKEFEGHRAQDKGYRAKERIFKAMEDECGVDMQEILHERGHPRRIAMDLLYCYGGLKGPEIGLLFGVDYSIVSQNRKRLRTLIEKDEGV